MSRLHAHIQAAKVEAAEREVVASIPPDLLAMLKAAQTEHEAKGGCPGCGHMVFACHYVPCSATAGDLY